MKSREATTERGAQRGWIHVLRVLPVGDARPQTVVLARDTIVLGRKGADVELLEDPEVSRRHAELRRDVMAGCWRLVDLHSRNGTFLDGARVVEARLVHQSLVRVGKTLVLFIEDEARPELPAQVELVARHELAVLVRGEAGLGAERVADLIHRRSGRGGELVVVRCASESAAAQLAAVRGGTLYLDEIAEMPMELQAELVRILPSAGARLVASTGHDLLGQVALGRFRADLYARLAGCVIDLPPLRRRREDVVPVASAWLEARGAPPLSVEAAQALLLHDWPGNERELEAVLEHALRLAGVAAIDLPAEHLPIPRRLS